MLIKLLITLLVIVAAVVAVVAWQARQSSVPPAEVVTFSEQQHTPLAVLVLQSGRAGRRVLRCEQRGCGLQVLPDAAGNEAVTDGQHWYYYEEVQDEEHEEPRRRLVRQAIGDGSVETIIEATPITSPQGLIISPDGKRLAFWLDNIDEPEEELTELWLYDAERGGVRLLAERLYTPDIRSRVRWNRSSTHLFFLADTAAADDPDRIELVVVGAQPPSVAARFGELDWDSLEEIMERGVVDVSFDGTTVALAQPTLFRRTKLLVAEASNVTRIRSVSGGIVYLQWLSDGRLRWGVQDESAFSFWEVAEGKARLLARQTGKLWSAQGSLSGEHVALAYESGSGRVELAALYLPVGTIVTMTTLPPFGEAVQIVRVAVQTVATPAVASVSRKLDDAELVAFVERNAEAILGARSVRLTRLVMTEQDNTLYVDYDSGAGGDQQRILLTVHDALQQDWSIKGRWREVRGEWQKAEGGGLPDPPAVRLYEWEESVGKWILKSSLLGD